MKLRNSNRLHIKANLADVYCKLDYLQRNKFVVPDAVYLDEAKKIVKLEIEHLRALGRASRPFRRLLLSLVEIESCAVGTASRKV
jgi:hypothetical protein